MFEFVCEHIVPGCPERDRDESQEKLLERVGAHLREHHHLERHDDRIAEALETTGITFIRPA